jgi:hypothetical protein
MKTLETRDPSHREMFQGLAAALQKLGGMTDETADAIQAAMNDDDFNFERSAQTIGVPLDTLIEAFQDAMLERGFYLRRIRVQ